ncbi:MAG: helix-turn-helix domain-containing protein [Clostridia bacterium]|nr:helix-turn-helix domain-containing protein [Clostridia bacterium]
MKDIKSAVARNIARLRQSQGMTQIELAQRLNYSDKAISKWERAESMPDISVLVEIADLFGVTLDWLVQEEHEPTETSEEAEWAEPAKVPRYNRSLITGIAVGIVWFIVTAVFVMISLISGKMGYQWVTFVYGFFVSTIVWLVFNSIWFNRRRNYLIISLITWSLIASIHVSLLPAGINIALLYLLGIPAQIMILMWSRIKKKDPRPVEKKEAEE